VRPEEDARAVALAPQVLFEGAQGLLLDELHPWFPHVTRSRTGLANPAALCAEAGIERLRAVYVTRWYLTRHGAGPLPTEIPGRPSPLVEDRTNLPNPWQGSLRFGHLDLALLRQSIRADLAGAGRVDAVPALALTCLDQAGPEVTVVQDGRQLPVPRQRLPEILEAATGLAVRWQSHGPTRDDVLAGVGRSAPKGRPASVL
jgi:adenylosuccinate synthase